MAFKLPGRCGDSPIIGAGCYTDQDVGSAGATGSGEENIKVAGAHTIVENMRHGMSPQDAGMDALKRIVRNYNGDMNKLRFMDMTYYVLRKDGAYAGVSCGRDIPRAIRTRSRCTTAPCAPKLRPRLLKGYSQEWPPFPAGSGGVEERFGVFEVAGDEDMGELSLACPDEGVWAYVGWDGVAVRGWAVVWELQDMGELSLACPDEGVWAYVGGVGWSCGSWLGCDLGNSDVTREPCAGMQREMDVARGFLSGVRAGRRRIPT